MNEQALKISQAVRDAGGRAMLVGGCVRDRLCGFTSKDFDLEVYYLEPARLRAVLQSIAQVNTVGEHFAVYKLTFSAASSVPPNPEPQTRFEIDVSIPRRESKTGQGHRGFVITGDPFMSFEEAARRRDFTINAILQDPLTEEIVDPFNGVADLREHMLRIVDPETFVEDSLRVLRAVQLAARFELTVEARTMELCRSIELSDLPRERIWGEIEKLLLLAARPSIGLQAALDLGVLDQLFPQLRSLVGDQAVDRRSNGQLPDNLDADDHSPDDAFGTTRRRLDEAACLTHDLPKEKRLAVMLAALCLDLRSTAPDAPQASEPISAVLDTLGLYTVANYDVRGQVVSLVQEADKPRAFFDAPQKAADGEFRRLAQRVDMNLLYRLAKADALASGFATTDAEDEFIARTRALDIEKGAPAPLLLGRHLLEEGIKPGKRMGEILRQVYELQLDGAVTSLEEAIIAARKYFET